MLSAFADPAYTFGSEAVNLEYSILSAILGNSNSPDSRPSPPSAATSTYANWAADALDFTPPTYTDPSIAAQPTDTSMGTSPTNTAQYLSYPYTSRTDEQSDLQYPNSQYQPSQPSQQIVHPLQPRHPLDARPRSPIQVPAVNPLRESAARALLSPPPSNGSPASTPISVPLPSEPITRPPSSLQTINDRVTTPYDYTEGYRFLMKHLPTRCVCSRTVSNRIESPWDSKSDFIPFLHVGFCTLHLDLETIPHTKGLKRTIF